MEISEINTVVAGMPQLKDKQVKAALKLMDEGNTIPFIARYRKEITGALDEVQLADIQASYHRAHELWERKQAVIKLIDEAGKMTPDLKKAVLAAKDLASVEDLYLPYKQKRQTKAQQARKAGLAPLANWILTYPSTALKEHAQDFVNDNVADADAALAGAHEILAEGISEIVTVRQWLRNYLANHGTLVSQVKAGGKDKDEQGVYQQYYDFSSPYQAMTSYRALAINRGEKAGVLRVQLQGDQATIDNYLQFRLIGNHPDSEASRFIMDAAQDAYKRFIGPSLERELRQQLTSQADDQAIKVFGENLYELLMQAPLKGKVVLGFDPAYRTGCKLAVIDPSGKLLTTAVIYPHKPAPEAKRQAAAGQLIDLINQYHVEMIAIGNGTASRESERFVADTIKQINRPVYYVIVSESGASVYSASADAREEFPDLPVEKRSAISIGRRLQDPLAELVKINPQAIGVGQYQHDLPAGQLKDELASVVERAVNQVGVNVNTASYQLLAYISGLSSTVAKNVVKYRDEHGRFNDRKQLTKVSRLGPKAYQQSVGFLRIIGGDNPLDNTDIHPESYRVAQQMLKAAGITDEKLGSAAANEKLAALSAGDFVDDQTGAATAADILTALQKPGRDLRDTRPAPFLRTDVMTIDDLKPGMELQGTVRNVVDFGAFVDIGVKHDGLVHVSAMSKKFVKAPRSVVSVGDIVKVWVLDVDLYRQRISLTMLPPKDNHD